MFNKLSKRTALNKIIFIISAYIFITFSAIASTGIPFVVQDIFKQKNSTYEKYTKLDLPDSVKTENKTIYGEFWKTNYIMNDKIDIDGFFMQVLENNPDLKLESENGRKKIYKTESNGKNTWYFVDLYGSRNGFYLRILKETNYEKLFSLPNENEPVYLKKVKEKLADNKLMPAPKGFAVSRNFYDKKGKLIVRFIDKADGRKMIKYEIDGEYWKAEYKNLKPVQNQDNRYQILNNMKDEIEKIGGKILLYKDSMLVFSYTDTDYKDKTTYGYLRAYSNSFTIELNQGTISE